VIVELPILHEDMGAQVRSRAVTLPGSAIIAGVVKIGDMIWIREWDSYYGDILGTGDKRKPVTFSTQTPPLLLISPILNFR